MLSHQPGDEAAAPDLPPRLQAAIDREENPPGRCLALTGEQVAKHDAITAKQLPGEPLDALRLRNRFSVRGAPQGPTANRHRAGRASAAGDRSQMAGGR